LDFLRARDQPDGGGTPDVPIRVDHASGAPVVIERFIN